MANSISIRWMTEADLPAAMRLKQQAGWNQLEADWRRALAVAPEGCFVAVDGDAVVGTTTFACFGNVAWIAMVLVDEAMRGRGIGQLLLNHALAELDRAGIKSVRLDATPLGRPLYEKLGFVAEFELARYHGVPQAGFTTDALRSPQPDELQAIVQFDRSVTGNDRQALLARLFAEWPGAARVLTRDDRLAGFVMSRAGANAVQIGPCLAVDDAAGRLLLEDALHRYRGERVYVDVPLPNRPAVELVEACGLTVERKLLRMCRGQAVGEQSDKIWASFGPEKG